MCQKRVILGLFWDNGKEHGNYYRILVCQKSRAHVGIYTIQPNAVALLFLASLLLESVILANAAVLQPSLVDAFLGAATGSLSSHYYVKARIMQRSIAIQFLFRFSGMC